MQSMHWSKLCIPAISVASPFSRLMFICRNTLILWNEFWSHYWIYLVCYKCVAFPFILKSQFRFCNYVANSVSCYHCLYFAKVRFVVIMITCLIFDMMVIFSLLSTQIQLVIMHSSHMFVCWAAKLGRLWNGDYKYPCRVVK